MSVAPLVYPRQLKGSSDKDYLKITIATEGGQGIYQFFDGGKGRSTNGGAKAPVNNSQGTIFLAMPRQLSVSYGMSYQGVDLGSLGSGLVSTAAGLSGTAGEGKTESQDIASQISGMANNAKPELALNTAATGVNSLIQAAGFSGGVDANSLSALMQGQTLNPFREITFKGANYRSHNFTVKMVARNKTEENEIKKIVNTLRYYMHPDLNGGQGGGGSIFNGGGNNRWLGIPSYFDLAFVRMQGSKGNQKRVKLNSSAEIENIYRPGACVLKNFNVNFAPDGQYVATEDYVMAVQIQMGFQETVMLHRSALKELKEF
jgi:hypothetical protein